MTRDISTRHHGFRHLFAAIALTLLGTAAHAETRVALVIGNGDYKNTTKLANPGNDATDVAAALRRPGFETITGFDLDKASMDDIEIRFARAARDADMAMVYYSGHAIQYAGTNYLMPVDAQLKDSTDLRRLAKFDDIVADLQQAKDFRIAVKVTDGFSLIGLSNVGADRTRNVQLLKESAWLDIPVVYTNQHRGIIAIEKGALSGQAYAQAFAAWGQ